MIGRVIRSKYKILDDVGRGGLATVYLARNVITGETVAVKVLHPQLVANSGENFLKRFEREAEILARLQDVHIPAVYDYGEEDGVNFIVMEYIQGVAVSSMISKRGGLPVDVALDICRQTLLGLQIAYENNIVHRDIKPANLMVTVANVVKVMDFGIAKNLEAQGLTQTGMLGTPNYISPEQADGRGTDTRSDIYSLGAALFEMLTGRLLFDGDSAITVAIKHISAPVPQIRGIRADLPLEVEALVNKALEKDPGARYQTPLEMVEAINAIIGEFAAPVLIDSAPLYSPDGTPRPNTLSGRTGAGVATPSRVLTPSGTLAPPRTGPITRLGATATDSTAVPGARTGVSPLVYVGAAVGLLVLVGLVGLVIGLVVLRGNGGAPLVEDVVLASALNSDGTARSAVTSYAPGDTFFLSVKVKDPDARTSLTTRWYFGNDTAPVSESTQNLSKAGTAYAGFSVAPTKPWSAGSYRVQVLLNGIVVRPLAFDVRSSDITGAAGTATAVATSVIASDAAPAELIAEGDRQVQNSKLDEAIALYKQANQKDPKNTAALSHWGRALAFQQKYADAIARLEEAKKTDPKDFEALGFLALTYDWNFRFDDAFDTIQLALGINPNNGDLHAFKAEILQDRSDDVNGADKEIQLAMSQSATHAVVWRAASFLALRKSNGGTDATQVKAAEDDLKKAIEIEPNFYLHYYELGVLYITTGRPDSAIDTFTKSSQLYSKSALPHYGLGKAYLAKRDCTKASAEFRISLSIDPNYQSAKEGLETRC